MRLSAKWSCFPCFSLLIYVSVKWSTHDIPVSLLHWDAFVSQINIGAHGSSSCRVACLLHPCHRLSNAASALPQSAAVHCVHRGQVSVSLFVVSSLMGFFFFLFFFVVVSKHKWGIISYRMVSWKDGFWSLTPNTGLITCYLMISEMELTCWL